MNRPHQLIIFDCDGVLVDSEMLSAAVLMGMMQESGLPITWDMFCADFLGRSFASAAARTEKRFGTSLPEDFQKRYRSRLLQHMRGRLQAMPGVQAVLINLRTPYCLATSSSPERLAVTLEETALEPWFQGKKFTASEVQNGKPAPDLFLHAALQMGVPPEHCLVIEDSEMGMRGAIAAGMEVWHFAGGAHINAGVALPPDLQECRALDSMTALHQAFVEIGVSEDSGAETGP
jgi:HAD superfamily hydrolase (TIGR01509 family)